jgi:exodeoxyribonuclease-3
MSSWASHPAHSVGYLSRIPIRHHEWHRPPPSRRAFLEIVPAGDSVRVFGVHLSAVHSNWTERLRVRELRAVLAGIEKHQHGFHVITGDFNTIAPGETLDIGKLPPRLRAVVWLTGGKIRWETIQNMLDSEYVDASRALHPADPGLTFPAPDPHVRLDYVFVPAKWAPRARTCDIVNGLEAIRTASDHLPLVTEIEEA